MEKKIKIHITSMQSELGETYISQLFSEDGSDELTEDAREQIDGVESSSEPTKMEFTTEGVLRENGGRITVEYGETELTGMDGATTNLSFESSSPGLVTMLRGGSVTTSLVFEQGKRHVSIYETPFMPFEICILTLKVKNSILEDGLILLDYVVEVKGAQAERTKFKMQIIPIKDGIEPIKEYS